MGSAVDADVMSAAMLELDVDTLTLGEMALCEAQSGQPFQVTLATALRGGATRRLLALWVHEQRSSARPRSWRELGDLRPPVSSSSPSPTTSGGPSPTSNG